MGLLAALQSLSSCFLCFSFTQEHPLVTSHVTGEGWFPPPCRRSRFLRLFPVGIYQAAMLFPFSHEKHFVSLGAGLPKQLAPGAGQKLRFSAQQKKGKEDWEKMVKKKRGWRGGMLSKTEVVQLFRRRNNSIWKRLSWRLDLPVDLGADCVWVADFTELGKATSSAAHLLCTGRSSISKGWRGNHSVLYLCDSYGYKINFSDLRYLNFSNFSLL